MERLYIVTGAAGFLGCNLLRALRRTFDGEIRALLLNEKQSAAIAEFHCKVFYGDVTKPETLERIFDVPHGAEVFVIHCAALVYIKSAFNPKVYDVNVNGTRNVARQTLRCGGRLIYVSSVHALPEKPKGEVMSEITNFRKEEVVGIYAKTKSEAAAEVLRMAAEDGLNACIVHPAGIIGPYDEGPSHTTQFIMDYCNGKLRACVHGGYNFVDVRDVAQGILSACTLGRSGECYILANQYFTVREILGIISREFGIKPIKTVLPMWFAMGTAPLSEAYYALLRQPPLYTRYSLYALTSNAAFSSEKAKRELHYTTRAMAQTLHDTVLWLMENGKIRPVG